MNSERQQKDKLDDLFDRYFDQLNKVSRLRTNCTLIEAEYHHARIRLIEGDINRLIDEELNTLLRGMRWFQNEKFLAKRAWGVHEIQKGMGMAIKSFNQNTFPYYPFPEESNHFH